MLCVPGYPCEPHNNPADFFLDVINGDFTATTKMHGSEGNGRHVKTMPWLLLSTFKNVFCLRNKMDLETFCTNNVENIVYYLVNFTW